MNSVNTIIFDLDGTLLPLDTDAFMDAYNKSVAGYFKEIMDPNVFIKALWTSTKATIDNKDYKKNDQVFKVEMQKYLGADLDVIYQRIYEFYDEAFMALGHHASQSSEMIKAVALLKEKGYRLLIATNPLFPMKANHTRIRWAGFEPEDFEYISCFEENHYCKPHLEFYEEVLTINSVKESEALMVGNNAQEDLVIKKLGVKTFLIDTHLIARDDLAYETDFQGDYKAFLEFAETLSVIK